MRWFAAFPFMHVLLAFILCSRSHLVLISSKKHGLIDGGALALVVVRKNWIREKLGGHGEPPQVAAGPLRPRSGPGGEYKQGHSS